MTGLGVSGLAIPPVFGRLIAADELLIALDVTLKKRIADAALAAATAAGASYADVRIGRYLHQFVITREDKVENIVNTESYGVGVRVIATGTWGFAATNELTKVGVARPPSRPSRSPRPTPSSQTEPVQLAPTAGRRRSLVGDADPEERDGSADQREGGPADGVNAAALKAGASFVNSHPFLVNEQKYFASTDGSYIDQDIHRLWPNFQVTVIDQKTGKFRTRDGCRRRWAWATNTWTAPRKTRCSCGGVDRVRKPYDMREDAIAAAAQAKEKLTAPVGRAGQVRSRAGSVASLAHHPRVGWPSDRARPCARLRGQLRRHQLRHPRQMEDREFKYGSAR